MSSYAIPASILQANDDTVHTFPDGTYTAVELLEILKYVLGEFIQKVFIKYDFGILLDETIFNLDRFNPNFTVDKIENLQFLIQLDDCPSIMQIFGLSASFSSLSSTAGGGNIRIYFDFDLSDTEYSNLEDRVARKLLRILVELTTLQTSYDDLSNDFE